MTGEAAGFGGVNPAAGYGAFEVAAPYEELVVDSAAFTDGFADAAKSAKRARFASALLAALPPFEI